MSTDHCCEASAGPWIWASACGMICVHSGRLTQANCPSRFCPPQLVPLDEHGRLTAHDGFVPGTCPWIGVRVFLGPGMAPEDFEPKRAQS